MSQAKQIEVSDIRKGWLDEIADKSERGPFPERWQEPAVEDFDITMKFSELSEMLDNVARAQLNEGRESQTREKDRLAEIIRAEISRLLAEGECKNVFLVSYLYDNRERLGLPYEKSSLETFVKPIAKALRGVARVPSP